MRRTRWAAGLIGGMLAVAHASPADPVSPGEERPDAVIIQVQQPPKSKELPKSKDVPPAKDPPGDQIARTDISDEAPVSYFTRMMGDWIGATYATQTVTLPGTQIVTTTLTQPVTTTETRIGPNGEPVRVQVTRNVPIGTKTTAVPALVTTQAQVPILSRGAFKIAENEKPSPEDRFILSYNGYSGVPVALPAAQGSIFNAGAGGTTITPLSSGARAQQPVFATQSLISGGAPTLIQTVVPAQSSFVHRAVVGFEKTIFDGIASVGVRAPFFSQQGDGSLGGQDLGDLTFVFKYLAWTNGPDALTLGVAATAPTGPAIPTVVGDIHSTLIQPFVGARAQAGDLFALAFSSVAIPTDRRDVTILFNDLAIGYVMHVGAPDALVQWIAPTAEVHVTTPLTNRNGNPLVSVPDLVVLTEGVQIGLGSGTTINLAVGVPVTGPRPFDVEGIFQLNFRY